MKSFDQQYREDRRLVLLRLLSEAPAYRANSSNLQAYLSAFAVRATRDDVRTDLAWLAEQDLVTTEEVVSGVVVATLTGRGADVAAGLAQVPGVSRPSPR